MVKSKGVFRKKVYGGIYLGMFLFFLLICRGNAFAQGGDFYTNPFYGYRYYTNKEYSVDTSKEELVTVLENKRSKISFFYDDLRGKNIQYETFVRFGNQDLFVNPGFTVYDSYATSVGGRRAHVVSYSRKKMEKVPGDKNFYTTISMAKSNSEVLTMMIQQERKITRGDIQAYISNISFIKKEGEIPVFKGKNLLKKHFSPQTNQFYQDFFIQRQKQHFGIYEPTFEYNPSSMTLQNLERKLDYSFNPLLSYQTTGIFSKEQEKNVNYWLYSKKNILDFCKKNDRIPLFTISTFENEKGIGQVDKTREILDGKCDYVLDEFVRLFKEAEIPILLRINNEMNGDWVRYCSHFQGKDPHIYVECYRYIHKYFTEAGIDNVIYVFNPNNRSFPDFSFNHYLSYYPGDEYVDVIGLTAYNTGNYYAGEKWTNFEDLYDGLYRDYAMRFEQPFMITEFSSSSFGGDKVAWMKNMMQKMKKYPKIKYAILWNGVDYDFKNPKNPTIARDYRITEDSVMEVLKKNLKFY